MEVSESQTNIGSKKDFGSKKKHLSEEILGPQTILRLKTLGSKEIVDPKKYWASINFTLKKYF